MSEIQIHGSKSNTARKYATIGQLKFQRKYHRSEIEQEIVDLERKFSFTSKIEDPTTWFDVQSRLGNMYHRLMELRNPIGKEIIKSKL